MTTTETRIQFYVGRSSINAALSERASPRLSPSEIAKRDLERYYALLRRSLPTFTEPEASLILDALNGMPTEPHSVALVTTIVDAIRLNALDQKWGVDGDTLSVRLVRLTPFELLAIADAVERFWNGDHSNRAAGLRHVGLVKD